MRSKYTITTGGRVLAALLAATVGGTATRAAEWHMSESTSPLTGAASVTAALDSAQPLANMLNLAQSATLVVRCQDRVLSTYVLWPQVITAIDIKAFVHTPETVAIWRIDNGAIALNSWDVSSEGTAAGKFTTGGAVKILRKLAPAHRLVVRLTGASPKTRCSSLAM